MRQSSGSRPSVAKTRLSPAVLDAGNVSGIISAMASGNAICLGYIGTRPSRKSIVKVCRTVGEMTSRRWLLKDPHDRVERLNWLLTGWANYFCLGSVSKAYRSVDAHTRSRLRSWLRKKHKMPDRGTARFPDTYLENSLGLKKLKLLTRDFPWATA